MRLIIVIDQSIKNEANLIAKNLTGNDADLNTWSVGLSPNGNTPVTHYWCNWEMSEEEADILQSQFASYVSGGTAYIYDAFQYIPEQVLTDKNLKTLFTP